MMPEIQHKPTVRSPIVPQIRQKLRSRKLKSSDNVSSRKTKVDRAKIVENATSVNGFCERSANVGRSLDRSLDRGRSVGTGAPSVLGLRATVIGRSGNEKPR